MSEQDALPEEVAPRRSWRRRLAAWTGWVLLVLVGLVVAASLAINTPFGKRFIADRIAEYAPASGLHFKVGRIEGDVFDRAVLRDVEVYDPQGRFLTIPEAVINWRPQSWFTSGLDIRELTARRGKLERMPHLLPGNPDAPILPDFDIRLDKLQIDHLTLEPGVAGDQAQRVDLLASANIRKGRALVKADGTIGKTDKLHLLLDAEPDGDRFDLDLNYVAPKGGALAALMGARAGYRARIVGDGTWQHWDGALLVTRDEDRFAAFKLANRAGHYRMVGQAYPGKLLTGLPARAAGRAVSLALLGTLQDSTLDGAVAMRSAGIDGEAEGAVDLARKRFDKVALAARLVDPALLGSGTQLDGARLSATLDGRFGEMTVAHKLSVARLVAGSTTAYGLEQKGTAKRIENGWTMPVDLTAAKVETGTELVDRRLVAGTARGMLTLSNGKLGAPRLAVVFPGLQAQIALAGDMARGTYRLDGPVSVQQLALDNVGALDGKANVLLAIGGETPWSLAAQLDAQVPRLANPTMADLAGPSLALRGTVRAGSAQPLALDKLAITGSKLTIDLDGKLVDGAASFTGSGEQARYGKFTVDGSIAQDGPRVTLVLASPLPAAGLSDVKLALAPDAKGFAIDTSGGSMLGPFKGKLLLATPANAPAQLAVKQLDIWKTSVSGLIALGKDGASGKLALAGGGMDGTVALSPRDGGQGFDVALTARNASFAGPTPITLASAKIAATGLLRDGHSSVQGSIFAQGLGYGQLFVGKLAANAALTDGKGTATASIAGRRGSRFALQLNADMAPGKIAAIARGEFAGRAITMPRHAVLTRQADSGWQLAPVQVSYGKGSLVAQGSVGGGRSQGTLHLADMPLSLADLFRDDLGLGGTISGIVDFAQAGDSPPTGSARVKVAQLTRSGLVLTSRPVDLALVARLDADRLEARAVVDEDGKRTGRLQARITGVPRMGKLYDRLQAGRLLAQLRYQGPADALWRLAAIEAFDLTGPISAAANVTGTLAQPNVAGSIASDALRVRSGLSGTDVRNVTARGSFAGSRLRLTSFSGETSGGGTVSGSGWVDLAQMDARRGPGIDIKIAARKAALVDAAGLTATVTGPLRMVSNGVGGTIAGRLQVDRASWQLGTAAAAAQLPNIRTREINQPPDIAPVIRPGRPWRYLIDANAPGRVDVDGMGLDSEWSADIRIRGTTSDPRIGGEAKVVRGQYNFAGTSFDLTRGRIAFDETQPIDPRLDIVAETSRDGMDVSVKVQGNALEPEISFNSTPALPEEEILARLLFGGSITNLSATDALQLGAAVASLRGGAGLDPINKLRSAIGLDRLRIVSADPAIGRNTAVALGKNVTRRIYVELVTDGQGYSATDTEFRITSWLSLLGSISTVGRDSIQLEVSKDY